MRFDGLDLKMGVDLYSILNGKEIKLPALQGKVIALDAHLVLYQFLTTIRGIDGNMLMDSKGNPTSHLQGIFSRTLKLLQEGIKPCFVFDGIPPKLKQVTLDARRKLKEQAKEELELAIEKKDVDGIRKYSARTTYLNKQMIQEAKELILALGVPVIEAPSEAEAQAAYLVKLGKAYAVGTSDADAFLFGAKKIVKNLTASGKRKVPGTLSFQEIYPELFDLNECLQNLGINQKQLIALGILVGTDYAPKGVDGIGPKKALKLIKKHKDDLPSLFNEVKWNEHQEVSWEEIYSTFEDIKVEDSEINFGSIDIDKVSKILCDDHDFSVDRIQTSLSKYQKEKKSQTGLSKWF